MCGLVGLVGKGNVAPDIYDALTVLQHRGQDAAGIMTCYGGRFTQRKSEGLVRDVFRQDHMQRLKGPMGIGHVRYPTAGSSGTALAQPFYVNSPYGIALAHNGNLTNSEQLTRELFQDDLRHLNTDSDSEVLLNVFAHELQTLGKLSPTADDVFQAVMAVHRRCRGGYAAVALIVDYGVVGFRDPLGIRPLVIGVRKTDAGDEYMLASESVALDVLGFSMLGDVAPGEAVFIDSRGAMHRRQCAQNPELRPCIFEHVYFARPDSLMDGISVYKTRMRQGEALARKVLRERPEHDIDVVIPIPDTSRIAGQSLASELGIKFREGFMKNRYIGRTFIMPGQSERKKSVRQKLNPVPLEFEGKNVMLVDDSIVRGTTCRQIIQMARDAGAAKVYFASAAPPVRYPNVYGIDMPSATELIAHGRTVDEVCTLIGADWLVYQDLEDLVNCSREGNKGTLGFDCSVFNGDYPTGDVDQAYLERIEALRNDDAQSRSRARVLAEGTVVGIHNDVS
ncbi:MAG TPA: amidophosphoribosyltransferase [Halieaceae bacterium]|jgi:amidophosphoribosyltransferase|nr:amidophosphoribosyltransferase [Haliea sp.]HAN69357.1 amidophosphoribosyltransferase [Halieaceae bacterium]MAA87969.1 amidophosphoribosyltransferase [Haliea sp.]MAD64513.1 amidophosphoribosyltransferase [Haliea sp.]MAY91794.1 amidophosphoribosyltransferase [Haliea sp.]MBP70520.1 amidophosphoribosyltransferase [Haliea sp.]|tara:strand:+ start:1485 stop:3008 length:1524 start_codon:yes stop_codon:yes gene_type:complete